MHESWNDTNDLNEALGDDFDVVAGWEDFNNKKEKKRPILFWLWGALSILGIAIIVCLLNGQNEQEGSLSISTDTSLNLTSNAKPSIAYSSDKKGLKEKSLSTNTVTDVSFTSLSKSSKTSKKANEKTQDHRLVSSSTVIETNLFQHKIGQQYILANTDKSILQNNKDVKEKEGNQVTTEEAIPYFLKPVSQNALINYLPSLINPLAIERVAITSLWDNLPKLPIKPLAAEKIRTFGLAYTYNRPKRTIKGADEMYQTLRQDGEEFLEQQQVDFTVTQSINERFFFSTGLTYGRYRSRLVEKIQILQSPVVYNDVIIETQTQNNITSEIRGEAIGSQLSINQSTRYQLHQSLSIPVQIGMHIPLKREWQLALRSGIAYNMWQHTKGSTYASTLPNGEFIPVTALGYRSVGTFEHISNLQLQKMITEQLSINFGLQTKFDLNNRIKKEIGVSDKWKSYGVSIGISRTW